MALFMDVHRTLPDGATADDVAQAHPADGKVFCLVDAPDAETARTVHSEAHGLLADEIYPVIQG